VTEAEFKAAHDDAYAAIDSLIDETTDLASLRQMAKDLHASKRDVGMELHGARKDLARIRHALCIPPFLAYGARIAFTYGDRGRILGNVSKVGRRQDGTVHFSAMGDDGTEYCAMSLDAEPVYVPPEPFTPEEQAQVDEAIRRATGETFAPPVLPGGTSRLEDLAASRRDLVAAYQHANPPTAPPKTGLAQELTETIARMEASDLTEFQRGVVYGFKEILRSYFATEGDPVLVNLLREAEWSGYVLGDPACPWCSKEKPQDWQSFPNHGHAPDCKAAPYLYPGEGS